MVTTRSQITNNPIQNTVPVGNNPITTQNIIMVQSEADRISAATAAAATAAAATAAAAANATAVGVTGGITGGGTVPPIPIPTPPTVTVPTGGAPAPHLGSMLSNVEVKSFFKDKDNMNCSTDDAVTALAVEGISIPEDLIDFEDDDIDNMSRNLTKLTTPIRLSAICVKRLKIAAECARFYHSIGRDLSKSNMSYLVMSIFWKQWQSLISEKKSTDKTVFPKMDRNTSILKWTEAAANSFASVIGSRNAPLSYVIRPDISSPVPLPPLEAGKPWAEIYGSIRSEMESCLTHDDPVFGDDNHKIFDMLHDSLQGTTYGATIIPHKRKKDGRAAWHALMTQHAGQDRWDAEVKRDTTFLTSHIWKGNGNITLSKHLAKHRQAFNDLQTSAGHVAHQLPNPRTRVTYALDSIKACNDPAVQARIANIEGDDAPNGKRNNFEAAVTHLLPADPVMENKTRRANGRAVVSAVTIKSGKGKSGVDLRWHPLKEYKSLNDSQRDELKSWRNSNEGKASIAASKKQYLDKKLKSGNGNSNGNGKRNRDGNNNDRKNVKFKKMIASVVTDTLQSQAKQQHEEAQINAITTSMMHHMKLPPPPAPAVAASASAGPSPQAIAERLSMMMKATTGTP